jgi:hypothetical protein
MKGKSNKLIQFFVIATTTYSLYKLVSNFLEVDTKPTVKEKINDYVNLTKDVAKNYIKKGKKKIKKSL